MRKLFVVLLFMFPLLWGCQVEEDEGVEGSKTSVRIDLFHGYYDVDAGYYLFLRFSAKAGDTLYFEARTKDGDGNIDYAFWADEENFNSWKGGSSSAQLRDYTEDVPYVSFYPGIPDSGEYYVVLGNDAVLGSKRFWVRAYLKGVR